MELTVMKNKKSDYVLSQIEEGSKTRPLPIVGIRKGRFLEFLIKKYKSKNVLEIGTLVGYSAILISRNMNKGRLTTLEINPKNVSKARINLEDAGIENSKVMTGDAKKIIPKLKEKFDFVFIDAEKKEYIHYLRLLKQNKLIDSGTMILADNVKIFAEEMKDYLDYVRNSKDYKSEYYEFGKDAMELTIKLV